MGQLNDILSKASDIVWGIPFLCCSLVQDFT